MMILLFIVCKDNFLYWCITALPTHNVKFISHVPQNSLFPVVPTHPFTSISLSHFLNPEAICLLNRGHRGHRLSVVWSISNTEPFIGSDLVGVAEMTGQGHGSITTGCWGAHNYTETRREKNQHSANSEISVMILCELIFKK